MPWTRKADLSRYMSDSERTGDLGLVSQVTIKMDHFSASACFHINE